MSDEVATIDPAHAEAVETEVTQVQAEADQVSADEQRTSDEGKHPLEPGGKRFNEVVARAHKAEDDRRALKEELQREREARIRLEERDKVLEETKAKTTQAQELSWQQLEDLIDQGKTTRADANAYREKIQHDKAVAEAEKRLAAKLDQDRRQARVTGDLDAYKREVPAIMEEGTPERQRVVDEYKYMTEILGYAQGLQTELAATRAALGSIDAVKQKKAAAQTARESRETFVETGTSGKGTISSKGDSIKNLSQREKDFYTRQIERGRYAGWEDVRKEIDEYKSLKGLK